MIDIIMNKMLEDWLAIYYDNDSHYYLGVNMKRFIIFAFLVFFATFANGSEPGGNVDEIAITIKDHVFSPSIIFIPADKKVKLVIDNQDVTPEEFESYDLHREKVINGKSKGIVMIGPLKAGEYKFKGEFNERTAKGVIKVQ